MRVAVVDLFAGAGGLGEGFASFGDVTAGVTFEDVMSVEENSAAHSTLLLRAWQRRLRSEGMSLDSWREYVRGHTLQPWRTGTEQQLWEQAELVARLASLGDASDDLALADLAAHQCEGYDARILIGGPPCQAYSIVGRARNRAESGYRAEEDKRHYLYQSYLAFLCRLRPEIFVIENVKGLVTSNVSGMRVLHNMLRDLSDPGAATGRKGAARYNAAEYRDRFEVRETYFYRVEEGFPRLLSRDVPPGVIEASYLIDTALMSGFRIEPTEVRNILVTRHQGAAP